MYLVGVNHLVQHDSAQHNLSRIARQKRAWFQADILGIIEIFDIAILAEEFNGEDKVKWGVSETKLERIAKDKKIEHRFCEATSLEKKKLGIAESDWDKREQFWLSQLRDYKDQNVLFRFWRRSLQFFR